MKSIDVEPTLSMSPMCCGTSKNDVSTGGDKRNVRPGHDCQVLVGQSVIRVSSSFGLMVSVSSMARVAPTYSDATRVRKAMPFASRPITHCSRTS